MNYRNPFNSPRVRFARVGSSPIKTQQGLALTPSIIADLTKKGLAVNSNIANMQFDDGVPNPPGVPIEQRRGVDPVDAWNSSKSAKVKLQNVINNNK